LKLFQTPPKQLWKKSERVIGNCAKPAGALGRLEELVEWLAAWQNRATPHIRSTNGCNFCWQSRRLPIRGVSAFPASVTRQMVGEFTTGGAAINQICRTLGIGLKVYD